ncbi:MAG: cysteine--tRNA ligase [Candidatus Aenigmarchaeota archaeon]|nr:cysteine--tRNA ligase [Candidatus Aenigmarchaeota archaeon]MDW8160330.1 cysteine--tRNA ligase [Candidatus Aenigmarchaeota archaeon]
MIKIFNTLSRRKQKFIPIEKGKVKIYTCGPTVYDYAHIGNLRTYINEDIIRRTFEVLGYNVLHVMNITDVGHLTSQADTGEDKIEKAAKEKQKTAWEIAEFFTQEFFKDIETLNIKKAHVIPKATEHIKEMQELIEKLKEKGYAYIIKDGIYYDTSKFKNYGKLSGMSFKKLNKYLIEGARVEPVEGKKNITDFALWKFSPPDKKRQMEWDYISEWKLDKKEFEKIKSFSEENHNIKILEVKDREDSVFVKFNFIGFPGWHIECSAMSMKYLGETFDIHAGGIDHIPIHHTNEIAQSEAATGKRFVNYWIHCNFLLVNGQKMSKSLGNYYTLRDLLSKGYSWREIRFLFASAHYRDEQNFTFESLNAAKNGLDRIKNFMINLKNFKGGRHTKEFTKVLLESKREFIKSMSDDFNTPKAIAAMFNFINNVNRMMEEGKISESDAKKSIDLILYFDKILGLKLEEWLKDEELDEEAKKLIEERERLRKEGKFEEADKIRELLKEKFKIVLEDTKDGTRWKRI